MTTSEIPTATYPAVVLTNRRDLYLPDALKSLEHLNPTHVVIVDDTGDAVWRATLENFAAHRVVPVGPEPMGYAAAMQKVWDVAWEFRSHVFFLEEDFTVDADVNLLALADILDATPHLAQVALQRQPWYENEKQEGVGLVGAMRANGVAFAERENWIQHDGGFTGNPSLINRGVFLDFPRWPKGPWNESQMGARLKARGWSFGYWGSEGHQTCTHHGHERAQTSHGY